MKYIKNKIQLCKDKIKNRKYENLTKEVVKWAKSGGILAELNSIDEISKKTADLNDVKCRLRTLGFDLADSSNSTLYALKLIEDGDLNAASKVNESLGDMLVTLILLAESLGINSAESLSAARKRARKRVNKPADIIAKQKKYAKKLFDNGYS